MRKRRWEPFLVLVAAPLVVMLATSGLLPSQEPGRSLAGTWRYVWYSFVLAVDGGSTATPYLIEEAELRQWSYLDGRTGTRDLDFWDLWGAGAAGALPLRIHGLGLGDPRPEGFTEHSGNDSTLLCSTASEAVLGLDGPALVCQVSTAKVVRVWGTRLELPGGRMVASGIRPEELVAELGHPDRVAWVGCFGNGFAEGWIYRQHSLVVEVYRGRVGWFHLGPEPFCLEDRF